MYVGAGDGHDDGNAAVAAAATAANTQNSGAHEDDRLLCWPVYCCC